MAGADEFILLERAAAGETEAFRALFEVHHEAVFRVAYRLTNEREVAEDITQDCVGRSGSFSMEWSGISCCSSGRLAAGTSR